MSYTALKNKIELDNKGLFNYHLGKLLKSGIIERFEYIGKKNGDRSYYDISQLGKRVINGLLSTMDYSDLEPANIQTDSPIVINTSIKNKMSIPKISSSVFVWMKTNPIFSSKLNDEDNIEYIDGSNAIEKPIQVIVTE